MAEQPNDKGMPATPHQKAEIFQYRIHNLAKQMKDAYAQLYAVMDVSTTAMNNLRSTGDLTHTKVEIDIDDYESRIQRTLPIIKQNVVNIKF